MKLTIQRNELWRGIDTVLDVVPNKPAIPVLGNLLLTAEEDQLKLAATDLDVSIQTTIPADVLESGKVTVPARTLAEIAREWPEAEVSIEVQNERIAISGKLGTTEGGEGTYVLTGMPPDDFPGMATSQAGLAVEFGASGSLGTGLLTKMINKTGFAVSRDETRPVLNGILWHFDADGLDMVATDGSRLAKFRKNVDLTKQLTNGKSVDVILPPHVCNHLVKLLAGTQDETATVTVGESQVFFDLGLGATQLLSRVIEGPYVDYGQVVPAQNDKELRVSTDQFLPAVRRVSILSSTYTHQVRLSLDASNIELMATSQEVGGEAREVVPATYDDEALEIGYNAIYLIEILRKMEDQEIVLELQNPVTATIVRPAEAVDGEEFFCLLMPLRPSG